MWSDTFQTQTVTTSDGVDIHLRHAGSGPPLLLLHGYPQTHAIWHEVAPRLARDFHVVCPDLRGYGDSSKPASVSDHANYSKRAMARDMMEVMQHLGYRRFSVAGHDRGARVVHRLARDYPEAILRACVMDILPTLYHFDRVDQHFAAGYYHWFFLIQPGGLPEQMIGNDPVYYLKEKLRRWGAPGAQFSPDAVAEYIRCFKDPETIRASCEDYRAAATIDLEHDRADADKPVTCPLLVLWGERGFVGRNYDVLSIWRDHGDRIEGRALDCGHFLPEEVSGEVYGEMHRFFSATS